MYYKQFMKQTSCVLLLDNGHDVAEVRKKNFKRNFQTQWNASFPGAITLHTEQGFTSQYIGSKGVN